MSAQFDNPDAAIIPSAFKGLIDDVNSQPNLIGQMMCASGICTTSGIPPWGEVNRHTAGKSVEEQAAESEGRFLDRIKTRYIDPPPAAAPQEETITLNRVVMGEEDDG